ncbi:MAG: exonuclease SbcCD subunit D C-terminal domain-containing protein [Desulforegulaceae bacterium]|nr:exonuclease SbcCD subunit D C-terminal domain-containing protein [Desulforegulaceae bacterium]
MKILHTSDWHLGKNLYGRKRYDEFKSFLDWLLDIIELEKTDAVLIAGDVFDTSTPSNKAQELYYNFISKASGLCKGIVITAGNHDSPTFLNAPKSLLKALSIHVTGSITENPEDEIVVLEDNKIPFAIICAVPYLRDRDIRTVETGETADDKNLKLISGIKDHYEKICFLAKEKQNQLKTKGFDNIPIICMGHLFAAGGTTIEGDGVRELYVGSLARTGTDIFPDFVDYTALGHLHIPQKVSGKENVRYCGSPIPMGFGEAKHDKKIIIAEFKDKTPKINEILIPCFQELVKIKGSIDEISEKIEELKAKKSSAWLEIEYTGSEVSGNLRQSIEEKIENTDMEIRRIKNKKIIESLKSSAKHEQTLDDLDVNQVFEKCLEAFEVNLEDKNDLISAYNHILSEIFTEDKNAE